MEDKGMSVEKVAIGIVIGGIIGVIIAILITLVLFWMLP